MVNEDFLTMFHRLTSVGWSEENGVNRLALNEYDIQFQVPCYVLVFNPVLFFSHVSSIDFLPAWARSIIIPELLHIFTSSSPEPVSP